MADDSSKIDKNVDDFAESQEPYAVSSIVNLRDANRYSRSLIKWCRSQQENSQASIAAISSTCTEFADCASIKAHQRPPDSLPTSQTGKKKFGSPRSRTKDSLNGLSIFIREPEHVKKDIKELSKDKKQASDPAISPSISKLIKNNGSQISFDFKHFTDPEDVVAEYINVHIYNRKRLEKVDAKRISASVIELHNAWKKNSKDLTVAESEGSLNVIRTGKCFPQSDKSSTNFARLERYLPSVKYMKRQVATNNLIFDPRPLDEMSIQKSAMQHQRAMQTALNVVPALADERNIKTKLKQSAPLLPIVSRTELKFVVLQDSEAHSILEKHTALPCIGQEKKKRMKRKQLQQSTNGFSDFDKSKRATEFKSHWQLLKLKTNLKWPKDCDSSPHIKRLHQPEVTDKYDKKKDEEPLLDLKKPNIKPPEFEVKNHLDKYSLRMNKSLSNNDEERTIPHPSSKIVNNMLKKLNIHDVGFYIKTEERETVNVQECTDSHRLPTSENKKLSQTCAAAIAGTQTQSVEKVMPMKHGQNTIHNESSHKSGTLTDNEKLPGSRPQIAEERNNLSMIQQNSGGHQTDKIAMRNENVFLTMALTGLESRIPQHLTTQISKSDFLRAELFAKPRNDNHSSLNFVNSSNKKIRGFGIDKDNSN